MAIRLAVIEGGSLFLAISGSVLWAHPLSRDWVDVGVYIGQALTLSLCCVASFYYNDLYDLRIFGKFDKFRSRLLRSLGVSFILLAAFYAIFPSLRPVEGALLSSLLIVVGLVLPLRGAVYAIMMKTRSFGERALILGTGQLASKIAREIETAPHFHYSIVGFVDVGDDGGKPPVPANPHPPYPIFRPESLENVVEELAPNRIIVALTERRGRLPFSDLLNLATAGVIVQDGIEVYERFAQKLPIESLTPSFLLFSEDFRKSRFQLGLRRAINLAVAAVGMVLAAPLILIIALLIKLDSSGPVFFVQERVGRGGRTFRLVKFRTMHGAPSDPTASVWDRDVSLRVTRVGKWLRKLRMDELPQFINILLGDMDLVGPRPEMASNVKTMEEEIPYYSLRHIVRPGITGWAQVKHGYSVSKEDVTEKLRYDLYYIKHMSFWFDLRILCDTVKIVLFGRGAR